MCNLVQKGVCSAPLARAVRSAYHKLLFATPYFFSRKKRNTVSPATKKRAGCRPRTTGKRLFSTAKENIVEIGTKGRVLCAVCSRRALCVRFLKFPHAEDARTNKRTDIVTPLQPLLKVPIGGANRGCCGSRKSAPCAFFFFTGRGGFSFSRIRKRKMGAHRKSCKLVQRGVCSAPLARAVRSAYHRLLFATPYFFSRKKRNTVSPATKKRAGCRPRTTGKRLFFHSKGKHRANWYSGACALRRLLAPCALRAAINFFSHQKKKNGGA